MPNTYSLHHLRDMLKLLDELIDVMEELVIDPTTQEWLKDMSWLRGDVERSLRHAELIALGKTRDAELRNEAVQRYGDNPVSEQPTSETDADAWDEEKAWQDELDKQEIRDEDERIRKYRYSKRD